MKNAHLAELDLDSGNARRREILFNSELAVALRHKYSGPTHPTPAAARYT